MTEVVPVERILGPALEGHADYQSIRAESSIDVKDQRQGVASRAENSDDDEQNPDTNKDSMARISWTCCKSKWFVYDGLGITCAGITYGLIVYALFVVIGVILLTDFPSSPWAYLHSILFTLLAVLAISAHARSMTTDPGTIPQGNFTEDNIKSAGYQPGDVVLRCTKCECIKVNRAHHCSTCQRCVRKMDHHCPWINNCVGEYNQKFFMLFTFYIMIISIYALGLAVNYVFSCADKEWKGCTYFSPPATIIFLIFLVFEGLLFGIFTMVMLCTQLKAVISDETTIENLKREKREKEGDWQLRLQQVFGGKLSVSWLSPFSATPVYRRRKDFVYNDV